MFGSQKVTETQGLYQDCCQLLNLQVEEPLFLIGTLATSASYLALKLLQIELRSVQQLCLPSNLGVQIRHLGGA
jgi:hypothetical protein